jgi:hypothetical protein
MQSVHPIKANCDWLSIAFARATLVFSPEDNPKQSVGGAEFGFAGLTIEHGELMSECQILQCEPGLGLDAGEQRRQKRRKDIQHIHLQLKYLLAGLM